MKNLLGKIIVNSCAVLYPNMLLYCINLNIMISRRYLSCITAE